MRSGRWTTTASGRRHTGLLDPCHRRLDGWRRLGPVTVQAGQRYEFALVSPAQQTLHIYYEPFVRSDYTLRLLQSLAIENVVGNRPGSMSGVNIRYKELWGNQGSRTTGC